MKEYKGTKLKQSFVNKIANDRMFAVPELKMYARSRGGVIFSDYINGQAVVLTARELIDLLPDDISWCVCKCVINSMK